MTYKLYYFDGKGAGETIRQVFAVAGEEYEDIRYSREQWPENKDRFPFGQLPVLEVDGVMLAQSASIARFVARKFGLAGKTPIEEAQADAIVDQIKDYFNEIRPFVMAEYGFGDGDVDKLREEKLIPARDKHFAYFTKILKENKSGYLVGDSLTYADLSLAESTAERVGRMPNFLDDFPEIKAHIDLVRSNPNLKKWIETRPVTPW